MKRLIRTIAILCFIWLTGGCEKDTEPTSDCPENGDPSSTAR